MPRSNKTFREWCKENNCTDLIKHLQDKRDADRYSYSSHTKVNWVCDLGHVFDKAIMDYTSYRSRRNVFNCPVCNGKRIVVGFNDLCTTNKSLADEWDFDKNVLKPTEVSHGSFKSVWWKCKYGHSWKARISSRDYGNGCPYCSSAKRTSQPEQIIYYYVLKYFPDALNMYSVNGISCDIYIPSKRIAIEYDGSAWHSSYFHDTSYKYDELKEIGVLLVTISGGNINSSKWTYSFDDKNLLINRFPNLLTNTLYLVFKDIFGISLDFSDYDKALIFAKERYYSDCNRIKLPDNMQFEWSPLNGYDFIYASNDNEDKLWKCFKGHTFKRRIDVVLRGRVTCPLCNNKSSFDYFLIYVGDGFSLVLDMSNGDLEYATDNDIIKYIGLGANIRGITIEDGRLIYDRFYMRRIKPTSFRSSFDRFYNLGFTCKSNNSLCIGITRYLNILFENYSAEKVHFYLNELIERGTYA